MAIKTDRNKKRLFLICPVRGRDPQEYQAVVEKLEAEYNVYWPPRDTPQDDETGFCICQKNRNAIRDADTIGIIWDGKSEGCLFDLGMAFAWQKHIKIIEMPPKTEGKSFQNMCHIWERQINERDQD